MVLFFVYYNFWLCCGVFFFYIGCPYVALTQGHISDRLEKTADRLLLLDYLTTELMAARILREKRPEKKIELKIVSVLQMYETLIAMSTSL